MIRKLLRSFAIGFGGIAQTIRAEPNMRIHCVAAVGVLIAAILFKLSALEWVAVTLCVGLVLAAECVNTAIERLADRVTTERDPLIKQAKDCSSAAVLIVALTAAIVGGIVFLPKIWAAAGW